MKHTYIKPAIRLHQLSCNVPINMSLTDSPAVKGQQLSKESVSFDSSESDSYEDLGE